ncbi:MAG: polysaccharide pyruvyl transferase family protein [Chloroflexia bacterium]
MSAVCILGWYGSPNIGDEAELDAILSMLAALPAPPSVTVFSTNPARTLAECGAYPGGLCALPRNPLARAALRALYRSRLLIFGGGGLIQDKTSIYNLPIFTAFGLLARLAGCRLQWWGVGVEPLVTAFGRAQARLLVRLVAPGGVSVRDEISLRLLAHAGVPRSVLRLSADPAISLRGTGAAGAAVRGRVAFCVRDLPNNASGRGAEYLLPVSVQRRLGGGGRAAHARRAAEFYRLMARAADYLIEAYGVRVVFVAFWPGRDDEIAATVRGQMRHADRAVIYGGPPIPRAVRELLGEMEMVVAVRLHALIFAAAGGVPGVGFSYARKVRGFMAGVGQEDRVFDPVGVKWPELRAALDDCWNTRAEMRPLLLERVAEMQALTAEDAAWAARLLSEGKAAL